MESLEVFWLGWPWIGLGGAVVFAFLLFGTDLFRSNHESRWRDPVWLACLLPPLLMFHEFEEYALHVAGGQHVFVTTLESIPVLPDLPLAHFAFLNMFIAWVALPIAAHLARKNPIIGLSGYGFILVNGLMHLVLGIAGAASGSSLLDSIGFFTGTFLFLPLNVWVWYVAAKGSFMNGRGVAVSLVAGIIGHVCLFPVMLGLGRVGAVALIAGDAFVCFAPLLFAWLGCKLFKVSAATASDSDFAISA